MLFAPEEQAQAIAKSVSDIKAEQIKLIFFTNISRKNYGESDPVASLNKKKSDEFRDKLQNMRRNQGMR